MQNLYTTTVRALQSLHVPDGVVIVVSLPNETRAERAKRFYNAFLDQDSIPESVELAKALLAHKRTTHLSWKKLGVPRNDFTQILESFIATHSKQANA